MAFSAGPSQHSWHPLMTWKTTTLDYWWNWRFFLCAIWVLFPVLIASLLIWKYEGTDEQEGTEDPNESPGVLYEDESWRPCLKHIHPAWLLAFRVVAFLLLSAFLVTYVSMEGAQTFYYYTQWTFSLVVIYFGLGSILSTYGCYQFLKRDGNYDSQVRLDEEQGAYVAPTTGTLSKLPARGKATVSHRTAGVWGYMFQIIYQTNAGAVMLTDCVFWIVIVPFLEMKDYELNLMMIGMHSVNLIFLIVDTTMNSMRFPWFRISYFTMWTAIYVLFQWIVHACISIWWPYPFMDLSSQYSPLWYLLVALMHVPCYAVFFFIVKLKHGILSRAFPHSYLM